MISLQTQLSIYADKNHVLLISDKFSYEGNLSFLHKSQTVTCMWFELHPWHYIYNVLTPSMALYIYNVLTPSLALYI